MSDLVEANALRELYFKIGAEYVTKPLFIKPKIPYVERAHTLPEVRPSTYSSAHSSKELSDTVRNNYTSLTLLPVFYQTNLSDERKTVYEKNFSYNGPVVLEYF